MRNFKRGLDEGWVSSIVNLLWWSLHSKRLYFNLFLLIARSRFCLSRHQIDLRLVFLAYVDKWFKTNQVCMSSLWWLLLSFKGFNSGLGSQTLRLWLIWHWRVYSFLLWLFILLRIFLYLPRCRWDNWTRGYRGPRGHSSDALRSENLTWCCSPRTNRLTRRSTGHHSWSRRCSSSHRSRPGPSARGGRFFTGQKLIWTYFFYAKFAVYESLSSFYKARAFEFSLDQAGFVTILSRFGVWTIFWNLVFDSFDQVIDTIRVCALIRRENLV